MATMIRFNAVVIRSTVYFKGTKRKTPGYEVVSLSLLPFPESVSASKAELTVPEIFWQ